MIIDTNNIRLFILSFRFFIMETLVVLKYLLMNSFLFGKYALQLRYVP